LPLLLQLLWPFLFSAILLSPHPVTSLLPQLIPGFINWYQSSLSSDLRESVSSKMTTCQQQFEAEIRDEIATINGALETNQQGMNAMQDDIQELKTSNQRLEQSIDALRIMIEKSLGKRAEDPPSSGVTAAQQTQQPSQAFTGEGILGGNPAGASNLNQFTFTAGSPHLQEPRIPPDPTVRTSNSLFTTSSSQIPVRSAALFSTPFYEAYPAVTHHHPAQNQVRLSRIEYPTYDGSTSIRGWIFQMEQCFNINGVFDDLIKTQTVSVYT